MKNLTAGQQASLTFLAKHFGENVAITRTQLVSLIREGRSNSAKGIPLGIRFIRKVPEYRLGRGQYLVTTSLTPALERDKFLAANASTKLPKEIRENPVRILELIKDEAVVAPLPKVQKKKASTTLGTKKKSKTTLGTLKGKTNKVETLANDRLLSSDFEDMDNLFGSDDIGQFMQEQIH